MKGNKKVFFTSLFCTLCVLVLGLGVLAVDYESRKTGFNDGNTLIQRILEQIPYGNLISERIML